jgi:hypothetical protein
MDDDISLSAIEVLRLLATASWDYRGPPDGEWILPYPPGGTVPS